MKIIYILISYASILVLFAQCKEQALEKVSLSETPKTSLKQHFSKAFLVGAALNEQQITASDTAAIRLIKTEFNTITPENCMKWEKIHPFPDTFNFEVSDQFVKLGDTYNMNVIGHTLVWHSQLAPWMNQVTDSILLSKYMQDHITKVAGRYKGRIYGWDVVNEALNDDGTLRESIFLNVIGEDYLELAFKFTEEADINAQLYYNDYDMWIPEKRAGALRMIKKIQESGAKIDGVGMQAHWGLIEPDLKEVEKSILAYSDLGLKVMITELDVTVLPNPWDKEGADVSQDFKELEGDATMNPFPQNLPDSVQQQLSERYAAIFNLFLKHQDKIERVTFWGVNDGNSWLNNWPIKGRTNYPLLFDRQNHKKKAYEGIFELDTTPTE